MSQFISDIKHHVKSWFEWKDILAWAKIVHPSWYELATQRKRPEIRETYRKKILREYYER